MFPCPCPRCLVLVCDYDNCVLKKLVGGMETLTFTQESSHAATRTRQTELAEFATSLKKNQTRDVAVEPREQAMEGVYWLIKLVEDPVRLATAIVTEHDQRFGHGSVVVRAKYYRHTYHVSPSKGREYEFLNNEVHTFDVDSVVRTPQTLKLVHHAGLYLEVLGQFF